MFVSKAYNHQLFSLRALDSKTYQFHVIYYQKNYKYHIASIALFVACCALRYASDCALGCALLFCVAFSVDLRYFCCCVAFCVAFCAAFCVAFCVSFYVGVCVAFCVFFVIWMVTSHLHDDI